MPDTVIESVLNGKLEKEFIIKWLNNESIEDAPDDCVLHCCSKSDFVAYFLTYIRNQTDSILQTNTNAQIIQNATPEKLLSTRRKHRRSTSEPTSDERTDSLSVKTDSRSHHESPNRDKKRTGRRVKTKLFNEDKSNSNISISSDESRLSIGVDKITISTPLKNGLKPEFPISSPVTPRSFANSSYDRCDTPRLSHRHSRSHEKSCLGDYLVTAMKSSKKKGKKNTSNDEEKVELDLSNSDAFPEIGARKSSSLRCEKRRIKPTNIDKSQKSLSLNSFSSDCFQQPSPLALLDNSAFKQQKFQPKESSIGFEAERSLLKQERHKLMEKFNILNTSTPPKTTMMPQIKITQKESIEITQTYIKVDVAKILMKDKLDALIEIYDILLKNNLILSVNTEIYFLISILMSKQIEDEYFNIECKLNESNMDSLLKSIHNSTYFAVKSLWHLRVILDVILDKNSLKTLGENKKVRSFCPDLAKFLLNIYCVRCERPPTSSSIVRLAVVKYNCDTDSGDNFSSANAQHLFKKQRDAFYELVRWYQETMSTGGSRTSFRARVKTLLSHGATASNHAHLAALFVAHMLAQCLPSDAQESKLSKLHRRLTCPAAPESHRAPHFTPAEMFYKEFIIHSESEAFRVHLRDALATEIISLDGTLVATEDRGNSNNLDLTGEYLQLSKKLGILAKFLGYLTSLPYSQVPTDITSKNANSTNHVMVIGADVNFKAPKEKVFENNIALRNYSQPTIDLKGILRNSTENSRLTITIPWLVQYLSMLDYTSLRLKYYSDLITTLFDIYYNKLTLNQIDVKKNTIIYLKSIMGWLFDLQHFPTDVSYKVVMFGISDGVDSCDLVDESTIIELCPCLKDVNLLLSSCRLSQEQKEMGSFRHITPVSLSVNPEDRMKNKEKELQARLEEEFLKSQPSSTRRVIEMVVERVTSTAVKEITARELVAARERARQLARRALAALPGEPHAVLLQQTTSIYTAQLATFTSSTLEAYRPLLLERSAAALSALLGSAGAGAARVAARRAGAALAGWLHTHAANTGIFCKDMDVETRTLVAMNEAPLTLAVAPTPLRDALLEEHTSVATTLILLKEHICLLLSSLPPGAAGPLLAMCASSVTSHNVYCRAPAQRAVLRLSVDLCLVYVSKKPQEVTESFLNKLHAIWNICCPDRKPYTPEEMLLPERRDDISPQLRNFEDDERMATPISDDEEKPNEIQESKEILSPKPRWQPLNLQPINTKYQPLTKSQPTSPMLQPVTTKWLQTSKSQPVSPKLQPVYSQPVYPSLRQTVKIQPASPRQSIKQPTSPRQTVKTQPVSPRQSSQVNDSDVKESIDSEQLECFDRILCPRNIVLLSKSQFDKNEVWECLATVLVFLLKHDYLSEDSLTEQCLAVYRQDWPQVILEGLSACMRSVSQRRSRQSVSKFTLFLEFLAEYCGDVGCEPSD